MNGMKFSKLDTARKEIKDFLKLTFGEALQLNADELKRANDLIETIGQASLQLDELRFKAANRFEENERAKFDARRLRPSTVIPEMPGVQSPEVEDGDALIAEPYLYDCYECGNTFQSTTAINPGPMAVCKDCFDRNGAK